MPRIINFEKVRKRRRFLETIKRFLFLALIASAIGGILLLNNIFVEQGLSVRISDLIESRGGTGFPADLPGGVIRDIKPMGKNLAVLTDAHLYLYNERARIVSSIQQMTDKTVILTNRNRILSFEVGSRGYRIHTPSRTDTRELEFGVFAADLSESGAFALVTSARQYVAEVAVYRSPGEDAVFRWSSPDNHINGVSLNPNGSHMAVSCVMTENGMLKSQLVLFRLDQADKIEVSFTDSLILYLDYQDTGRICVLTDREYAILNSDGRKLHSYALEHPVTGIKTFGVETLLLTEYREARTGSVILFDGELAVKARRSAPNNIREMAIGRQRIYILDDEGIKSFDRQLNLMEQLDRRGISHIQLAGDKLYYAAPDELRVFGDE